LKKIIAIVTVSLFALLAGYEFSFAGNAKSNAKFEIDKGLKLHKKIESDKELADFYPHIEYNKGFTHLNEAINQFKNESEFELASYYAVLAIIEFETARAIAETRSYRYKTLENEVKFFKNAAKEQMLKTAIMAANLEKIGKAYQGMVEDKDLFVGRTVTLDPRAKKNILDKILDVVKLYPESKIIIKGHTRYTDRDNTKSLQKAKSVAEYFTIEKGLKEDTVSIEGMGNSQPLMIKSGTRLFPKPADRVELVITGLD